MYFNIEIVAEGKAQFTINMLKGQLNQILTVVTIAFDLFMIAYIFLY